jgi:hypothetical protein
MSFVLTFLWGWLAAAWFLGFAMGWISVVSRDSGLSRATLQQVLLFAAALAALAVVQAVPGRAGYALDLALLMGVAYVAGCVPGAWLRDRVVARNLRRAARP